MAWVASCRQPGIVAGVALDLPRCNPDGILRVTSIVLPCSLFYCQVT